VEVTEIFGHDAEEEAGAKDEELEERYECEKWTCKVSVDAIS